MRSSLPGRQSLRSLGSKRKGTKFSPHTLHLITDPSLHLTPPPARSTHTHWTYTINVRSLLIFSFFWPTCLNEGFFCSQAEWSIYWPILYEHKLLNTNHYLKLFKVWLGHEEIAQRIQVWITVVVHNNFSNSNSWGFQYPLLTSLPTPHSTHMSYTQTSWQNTIDLRIKCG